MADSDPFIVEALPASAEANTADGPRRRNALFTLSGRLRKFTHLAGWTLPVVVVHLAAGTAIWYYLQPEAHIQDVFYFAVVSFLTIGYGDISPADSVAKAWFIAYVILSLLVQLTVVTTLVSKAFTLHEGVPLNPLLRSTSSGIDVTRVHFLPPKPMSILTCLRIRVRKLLIATAILTGLILLGASMLHVREGVPWLDSIYWAVGTLATVGYGDIVPDEDRVLFALYFLVGVTVFGYVLGEAVALITEVMRLRKLSRVFSHGLTMEMIEKMDYFADGQVSKAEFLMFMLQEMHMASAQELKQILKLFDLLDITHNGRLDVEDVRETFRLSGHLADLPWYLRSTARAPTYSAQNC